MIIMWPFRKTDKLPERDRTLIYGKNCYQNQDLGKPLNATERDPYERRAPLLFPPSE